jgi:hypothetical protein
MDYSDFDSIFLDALTRVQQAQDGFEQTFYAPQVTQLGRTIWEAMRPEQRQMAIDKQPSLADGVKRLLGKT